MLIYTGIILGCWLIYLAGWTLLARWSKPNLPGGGAGWLQMGMRLFVFVIIAMIFTVPSLRSHIAPHGWLRATDDPIRGIVGDMLCMAGIALAFWARFSLGRNWGMPMSHKEEAELVTAGPYRVIRHPIYSALLLATLGSAIGSSLAWLLPFMTMAAYFLYSAGQEEKRMLKLFPDYAAYRQRSWMLVPGVF